MPEIPAELLETFKLLDGETARRLTDALTPVAGELGPRELAVLERLVRGIADGAPAGELNAFVRLLQGVDGEAGHAGRRPGDGEPGRAAGHRARHRLTPPRGRAPVSPQPAQ